MLAVMSAVAKARDFEEVPVRASASNINSDETIQKNGGVLLCDDHGSKYYMIKLW